MRIPPCLQIVPQFSFPCPIHPLSSRLRPQFPAAPLIMGLDTFTPIGDCLHRSAQAEAGGDNPFARLPKLGDDRAALIIWRGPTSYLILNKFPTTSASARHPLPRSPRAVRLDSRRTRRPDGDHPQGPGHSPARIEPDGFNVGFNFGRVAGAGIPQHLHAHIVPRWNGDVNFMPVIADTKCCPSPSTASGGACCLSPEN